MLKIGLIIGQVKVEGRVAVADQRVIFFDQLGDLEQ